MSEKKKTKRRGIRILLALLLLVALVLGGVAYYYFYSPFSAREETQYVYIDKGDDIAKVYAMLDTIGKPHCLQGFKKLASIVLFIANDTTHINNIIGEFTGYLWRMSSYNYLGIGVHL